MIPLVPDPKDWSGNEKVFTLIDSSGSDPKDWSGNEKFTLIDLVLWCNEKRLHSLIPLVLTLRIGGVMRNVYTH